MCTHKKSTLFGCCTMNSMYVRQQGRNQKIYTLVGLWNRVRPALNHLTIMSSIFSTYKLTAYIVLQKLDPMFARLYLIHLAFSYVLPPTIPHALSLLPNYFFCQYEGGSEGVMTDVARQAHSLSFLPHYNYSYNLVKPLNSLFRIMAGIHEQGILNIFSAASKYSSLDLQDHTYNRGWRLVQNRSVYIPSIGYLSNHVSGCVLNPLKVPKRGAMGPFRTPVKVLATLCALCDISMNAVTS